MNQNNLENNKFITFSLLILALLAIGFILNFTKPIMIPFVMALLIRILIDPIIDFQINVLLVHRLIAVFVSVLLIVFVFIIIVPFIVGSVATFLQSANEYNSKTFKPKVSNPFQMPLQSELTNIQVDEILGSGFSHLTKLDESYLLHKPMLNAFNSHLSVINNMQNLICPVT